MSKAKDLSELGGVIVTDGSNVGIGTVGRSASGYTILSVDNATNGGVIEVLQNGTLKGQLFYDGTQTRLRSNLSTDLVLDTNDTERMRIDSSGNVGIGLTPTAKFHVGGTIQSQIGSSVAQMYTDGGAAYFSSVGAYPSLFLTNGSERMRIDSGGNVLVGQTSPNSNAVGIGALPNGTLYSTRDGGSPLSLNRKTSDGDIAVFQKDGATVGSIGVEGGDNFYITDNNNTGLNMKSGLIIPCNTNGSTRDNAIDLGASGGRFNDLYLGGGVYLGGTGSANHLDDYEEGTFNPFSGVSSAYTGETTENARYVKIGGAVHVDIRLQWTGTDNSGNPVNFILPFTATATTQCANTGIAFYSGTQLKGGSTISCHIGANTTGLTFYSTDGGSFDSLKRNEVNSSYDFLVSFTYFVH